MQTQENLILRERLNETWHFPVVSVRSPKKLTLDSTRFLKPPAYPYTGMAHVNASYSL